MQKSPYSAFIALVHFDQETNTLRAQLLVEQKEITLLKEKKIDLALEGQTAQQHLITLRKTIDMHELEIKELEEQRIHKAKLMETISVQREIQALRKEIELIRTKQSYAEQELVAAWNAFDTAKKSTELKLKALQGQEAAVSEKITQAEQKIAELITEIRKRETMWSDRAHGLPEELLQKYMMMRMSVTNPVVPVEQEACSVCFNSLTRQDMVHLNKSQLLQCKGCYRFLYVPLLN